MAFAPGQGNDQGLCLASPGCRLPPGCICGVPSIQHKAQIPPLGNRESSGQLLAQRIQGQKPGATDHGSTESCFAHRPKGWAELGGISANGQLVTKPTLFLKLGHSRETGTAELSPNRTVAHLVPGPSGTPGRGGGGVGRWPLPRMERQSKAWRVGREVNIMAIGADAQPNSLLEGRRSSPTYPHLATGCSLHCPTSEPLLTWVLCLECCSPSDSQIPTILIPLTTD